MVFSLIMLRISKFKFWNRYFGQLSCDRQHCRILSLKTFVYNENYSQISKRVRNVHVSRNIHATSKLNLNVNNRIDTKEISEQLFNIVCEETLESLTEFFEDLLDTNANLKSADASYNNGVLTINFGNLGTYVINRQSPNKQIWLSSPISGPKRYDYDIDKDIWFYKHDNRSLHELLQTELEQLLNEQVDLSKCAHSNKIKT